MSIICPYCLSELHERAAACPHCGGVFAGRNPAGSLPVGTVLGGRYTVGEIERIDGEGILYRGAENVGRFRVTIKEYMPLTLAAERGKDCILRPKPGSEVLFKTTRMDFADLYRSIQRITPANGLEAVLDVFEENNTVYAVMENPGGVPLGRWLETQRLVRAGQKPGRLDADRIAKLDKLGIEWKQRSELAWERAFAAAKKYRDDHGDLLVPVRYHDRSGFALGEWIVYNRQRYISGNLSRARIERLEAIGMVWNASTDLWEQSYAAAARYYLEHKDLEAPIKYVTPDGFALGVWLSSQRSAYKNGDLTEEQIERLEAIGINWVNRNVRKWQENFEAAKKYKETYGNLEVPSNYVTPDGVLLGKWIARQRYTWQNPEHSSARVTPERKAQLDELGMVWEKYDPWQERYDLAKKYQEEHGDLNVPLNYKSEDGIWLGSWLYRQRQYLRTGDPRLADDHRKELETLLKSEKPSKQHPARRRSENLREQNWENNFDAAKQYFEEHGNLLVPSNYVSADGFRLGVWMSNLRAARKTRPDSFQVTQEHIERLDAIGMEWDARIAKWDLAYEHAEAYAQQHGDLLPPATFRCEDGFGLGDWVRRMRTAYVEHDPKLTPERIDRLNQIGMQWVLHRKEEQ